MNHRILFVALSSLLLVSSTAVAADEGKITILSPAEGTVIHPGDTVKVEYAAEMGPRGDHLHLYLDERRIDVLHQPKGTGEVRVLLPGAHQICLTINTGWHFSTGVKQCVNITAK